jgi:hypothetical protein
LRAALIGVACAANSAADAAEVVEEEGQAATGHRISYGSRGLEFSRGETDLWLGVRLQTRFDTFPGSLTSVDDLLAEPDARLSLKRGRIKGGGTLFRDWLNVYGEYNFPSDTLLDYRATVSLTRWLNVRAGQWKSEFNRERIDSSGKQQLVERSIANYWFTVDRQRGLAFDARLGEGGPGDTKAWLEVLSGRGRGGSFGDGESLVLARVQWNPAGEVLAFSQSDLARRADPVPSIAVAYLTGDTPFTRFSTDGGGQLPGFEAGSYRLEQWLFETALQFRGLGWQQELHLKRIRDRRSGAVTRLAGGYAQLGSFLNEWWPAVPAPLELVGRFSLVDPNREVGGNSQMEWTLGANWYFNGHRNKLTLDYSWLDFEDPDGQASEQRLRLQWELSL